MTPAQKTSLDARQSIERIEHLVNWLERHRQVVAENQPGLISELKVLSARYRTVQQAVDQPPAIALVSEWANLRAQMVGALTSPQTPPSDAELKHNEAEIFRRLLLRSGNAERAVAVRYRASEASAPPRDHPFRIGLLGIADLAAIMVGVHQVCFPGGTPAHETLSRMSAIHQDVAAKVQPATMPGLSEADVMWLQETIERNYPATPGLRLLTAANYWRDLADVASHIPDGERVRALSLLWNDQPDITKLFAEMVAALSQLGYTAEAFVTREALLERDPASGWFVVHPDSIVAAATLNQLTRGNDKSMRIVGRYGHPTTMPRSIIAALTAEVCLPALAGAMASLASADVIDFPAVELPNDLDVAPTRRLRRMQAITGASDPQQLVRVFAHAKARYLLDRSSRRHELTCMVACVESGARASGLLSGAVGDWVEATHGTEPHQRERVPTRLFVVAEAIESAPLAQAAGQVEPAPARDVLTYHIHHTIAAGLPWLAQWTPGEPFGNTYTVRLDRSVRKEMPAAPRNTTIVPAIASAMGTGRSNDALSLPLTPIATRNDAQRLLDSVASVSQRASKDRELRRQLAELHQRVRSRLSRYRSDMDPTDMDDWRRRVAAILAHRLQHISREKRLGMLLSALRIEEAQLVAIYQRSDFASLDERTKSVARPLNAIEVETLDIAQSQPALVPRAMSMALAQAAVGQWFQSMRQLVRAEQFCRQVGIPVWVGEHLVDEISIGAVRQGLVRRVAEVIESFVARTHAGERAFASTVAAVLHGFLERLDIDDKRVPRLGAAQTQSDMVLEQSDITDTAGEARTATEWRPFAELWCEAFSRLVEMNITNAQYTPSSDATAELARLLSEFPNIRLEV